MTKVIQFLKIGYAWLLLASVGVPVASWAGPFRSEQTSNEIASSGSTNEYVANKSSIRQLLSTLAGEIYKPIIVNRYRESSIWTNRCSCLNIWPPKRL